MMWPIKTLEECLEKIVGGGTPSKSNPGYWDGDIPWASVKDIKEGESTLKSTEDFITDAGLKNSAANLIPAGSIIISTRMGLGRVVKTEIDTAINQDLKALFPGKDLDADYLLLFLRSKAKELIEKGSGATVSGIKLYVLKSLEILVPPIEEQRKIVARIEKQFAKIDEVARLRRESEVVTAQLLPVALHEIFSQAESRGWDVSTIEAVTEVVTKGTTPKTMGHAYTDSGVPFLKAENVNGGAIDASSTRTFISQQTHNILSRSKTRSGDVLMTIAGTIGRLGWIPEHAPEMNTNQAVAIIRPMKDIIFTPYLAYVLAGGAAQEQVSTGTVKAAIPNFSLGMIKKMSIPLPPLTEQKEIVKKLDALSEKVRALQELQSAQTADLKALKQSILHQAFSGK